MPTSGTARPQWVRLTQEYESSPTRQSRRRRARPAHLEPWRGVQGMARGDLCPLFAKTILVKRNVQNPSLYR